MKRRRRKSRSASENPEDLAAAIAEIHASVPWDSAYEVEEVA